MIRDYQCLAIIAFEFVGVPCPRDLEASQWFEDVGTRPYVGSDSVWSFPISCQFPFVGVFVAHVCPTEDEASWVEVSGSYFPVVLGSSSLFDSDLS